MWNPLMCIAGVAIASLIGVSCLVTMSSFVANFFVFIVFTGNNGVQVDQGPYARGTTDFLWMMIFGSLSLLVLPLIPPFWNPFLGIFLVYMLLYVWSREFTNAQISLYGLVTLKVSLICLIFNIIFICIYITGHVYYFLTVLHPLASGKNYLKTPNWVKFFIHRFVISDSVYKILAYVV
ncbi:hypothetical protein MKW92_042364 [Papaver armeniacum]|nr:hypothetical protein MKW92_042364 [Papaver armeniacum]